MVAPLDRFPLFVRGGAVLPLARPTLHTVDPAGLELTARVYGDGSLACTLYGDDGVSLDHERGRYNRLTLSWDAASQQGRAERKGDYQGTCYTVSTWERRGE